MADDPEAVIRELRARRAGNVITALIKIGEDLVGRAARIAPVEEGTLRGSGTVVILVNGVRYEGEGAYPAAREAAIAHARAGGTVRADVEVAFNTIYAARQHEELEYDHPKGGQAKYLEQPFREHLHRYERILEAAAAHTGTL